VKQSVSRMPFASKWEQLEKERERESKPRLIVTPTCDNIKRLEVLQKTRPGRVYPLPGATGVGRRFRLKESTRGRFGHC
jgi:hypothetical protein